MRFLEAPLVVSNRRGFGYPETPGFTAAAGFGTWLSDPVDCRGQVSLTLEMASPQIASPAMLLAPSVTAGLGLLFVSQPGSAQDAIQITISTPAAAPVQRSIVTTGNSIVITPQVGDINANIAELVNGTQANTTTVGAISATAGTIPVASTAGFSPTGTLDINDTTGAVEQIAYAGLSVVAGLPAFIGCTGGSAGETFAAGVCVSLSNPASALVHAYPYGWQGYGDMSVVPQDNPIRGAEIDLVKAMSISNLIGGCDAVGGAVPPSQNVTVNIFGSTSPNTLGFDFNAPLATGVLGNSTASLSVDKPPRWVVAQFVPIAGSFGNVIANWFGRAAS